MEAELYLIIVGFMAVDQYMLAIFTFSRFFDQLESLVLAATLF